MTESSTRIFKTICVFDSIEFYKNKEYLKVVAELGITLATRKIDRVYKEGSLKLKDTVAVITNIRSSRVLGIILKTLAIV